MLLSSVQLSDIFTPRDVSCICYQNKKILHISCSYIFKNIKFRVNFSMVRWTRSGINLLCTSRYWPQVHSKRTHKNINSSSCTFQLLRVRSEVILWPVLTRLLCQRLTFPAGPSRPDCGPFRRDSEYDRSNLKSEQQNNTLVPPTLALASRSLC